MQKQLKQKLGRYIHTGFVAVQLYVNPVLTFGFTFLSLTTSWPKKSQLIMPLPTPKIFELLVFWRPLKGYLFTLSAMRTLVGQIKEGQIGIGFFMIKLIWSHYEPVTKLSAVLMRLTTIILAFYQVGRQPLNSMQARVYHWVYKQVFCWCFWQRVSHFCSNSYRGVQVTYALSMWSRVYCYCCNLYGRVQLKYALRARFRVWRIYRVFN